MIITCKECETRFNLDESLLKKTGSKVRCSKCKSIFLAYPPALPKESDNLEDKKPEMPKDEFSQEQLGFETEDLEQEKQFGDQPEMQDDSSGFEEDSLSDIGKMLEMEEEPEAASESETEAQDLEAEGLDLS
ncbi:MAG: zinc-ribbon domain-containing protein, partial [Desulfobacterales bacterium]|nr:zinc-ribbon domain-containing protein [Desulfobacterales bacterium]